ncbi:CYTH domain-containing protein [Georgenia halophila]|uniref:CYTH domain-containing protein n=1 Tax=Georgenia halophila TaxID=620889 RepID=A0ABP8LBM9_9MICO
MSDTGYGDFEFERKFFVRSLPDVVLTEPDPVLIVQSYFLAAEGYALRIRLQAPAPREPVPAGAGVDEVLDRMGDISFCALTAKGPEISGTRYEAERELDVSVGLSMVRLGGDKVVKYRHSLWLGTDGWVLDAFLGENGPLIVAECERGGPVTDLTIPEFCVTEVTDDPRFSNDSLAVRPYSTWWQDFERELAVKGPRFLESFGHNELGAS